MQIRFHQTWWARLALNTSNCVLAPPRLILYVPLAKPHCHTRSTAPCVTLEPHHALTSVTDVGRDRRMDRHNAPCVSLPSLCAVSVRINPQASQVWLRPICISNHVPVVEMIGSAAVRRLQDHKFDPVTSGHSLTSFRHAPRGKPSSSPRHEGAGPPPTLGGSSCLKPQVCEQPDQG